jgi:hypothetical protein
LRRLAREPEQIPGFMSNAVLIAFRVTGSFELKITS